MPNKAKNIEIGGRQLHYVDQGEEGQPPAIFIMADSMIIDVGNFRLTLFQASTVPSHTAEGLLIQTSGLAMLLKLIPLRIMLEI